MLELIKDFAMEKGIRCRGEWFGLYATDAEIRQVYARNAFNVAKGRRVHKRHIENWQQIEEVFIMGDLDTDDYAVFISVPEFIRMQLPRFSQVNGLSMDKAIQDTTWPALVDLGLMTVITAGDSDAA